MGCVRIEKGAKQVLTAGCCFLYEGPEESGSGRYGPHYATDTEAGEDDDTFEDDLDLDISFEEVTRSPAL